MQLPALMLELQASDALEDPAVMDAAAAAVSAGATAVILMDTGAGGTAQLYEAALKVKAMLRGRAALLMDDRADIANVVGADGVVLAAQGEG